MANKKISVIIPCYNVSMFVDRCMESLEKQTIGIDNLEIILINDASKDATLGKLLLWEMKYPENITVIPLEENIMQGAARNIARQYCTAEYIAYLDADDWILPNAFEKIYRVARQNNADIVNYLSKKTYVGPDEDDPTTKSGKPDRFVEVRTPQERLDFFMGDCPLLRGCWDKLFRRDFVEEHNLLFAEGVFDEESLFTTPAYLHFKRIYLLNEYLHRYYQNPISSTYNLMRDMKRRDDNARTWEATYQVMKEDGSLDENYELAEWFFIINYFIRSLVFATGRGIPYDLKAVQEMQDTVHRYFPNYMQNKSLQKRELYREPMKLIDVPLDESNFAEYNAAWEEIVKTYPDGL
ncbi:MAG: glycosyltransferase [Lachnospiraceae bacterium]|nr:glycosyltransferase [Lachnospiraceae bacterium]MBR1523116.1 glycosyltransferase [Lachnospiraceae bacterium]